MLKRTMVILGMVAAANVGLAQERDKLIGVWKLVSFDVERQATGERRPQYGAKPNGYMVFTPEGRWIGMVTAEGRKPGSMDAERLALYRTLIAYSGMYTVEGDKFITKVDISWNESWTGTEQVRTYKLYGDRLDIMSQWQPATNLPELGMTRGILTWERVK